METEEQVVYSILETVKKGTFSDDGKIDERVVRAFLKTYRAVALSKYSMEGLTISDECFQYLGELEFTPNARIKQYERILPKIIRLRSNFGLFFQKNGENIPVLGSEEFDLGIKNIINGKIPKAKFLGSKATIFVGKKNDIICRDKTVNNLILNDFTEELIENSGANVSVEVYAVLDDPDNALEYNWTTDVYPCPSELIADIKTQILAKEFNLILQVVSDKTTNGNDEGSIDQQRRQNYSNSRD
jgi:hypothetical protein